MRRRPRARGEPVKTRRRKAATLKRRNAPKVAHHRESSAAGLNKKVALFKRERDEALEQQKATAEVLRIISSSPGELEPVFQAVLQNAVRICEAKFSSLFLYDGERFRVGALHNAPAGFAEFRRREPVFRPPPGTGLAQIVATKRTVHDPDITLDKGYVDRNPIVVAAVELGGFRTVLTVPMLEDDNLIGCISIYRQEVRPFTDKQIELVTNFAAQAVIAIENTRLLNELRQRTDDLSESLEQQTATSEVLKVVSSSPRELEPVFQAMLENATRICEAKFGVLHRFDGETFHLAAEVGSPPEYAEFQRQRGPFQPTQGRLLERVMLTKEVCHTADAAAEAAPSMAAKFAGARTQVVVPMLKEGNLIGTIIIYRQEVRPFTDKQIALVQNFAAQAVIAIENARLLSELLESLERQTATSEVLQAISSSPGDLQTVFDTILKNATHLCEAKFGNLFLHDHGTFRTVALHNAPPAYAEARMEGLIRPPPDTALGQLVQTKQVVQIADVRAEPGYIRRDPMFVAGVELAGMRTLLAVPMLKENELIGSINIYRQEVRPFTEKQIALVRNFAAQAVIAIENVRLFKAEQQRTRELTESLEQQTATSDVLQVISSSPGELEPVFQAMLENALRICEAKSGNLFGFDGQKFYLRADLGTPPAFAEFARHPRIWGRDTVLGQVTRTKQAVHIIDVLADDTYANQDPGRMMAVNVAGTRTLLAVPMLREKELIGAFVIFRQVVRPFTDKQINLVTSFAAQAVIAIENTRLLKDLRESLQQQTATADVLKVISRSTFDLQTVLDTLVESVTRLCGADHAWLFQRDGEFFRWVASYGHATEVHGRLRDYFKDREVPVDRGSITGRTALEARVVQVSDVLADPDYTWSEAQKIGGYRAALGAPLLRKGEVVGVIFVNKIVAEPFTEKQIDLVTTFADQAVIAIENTRLLNELRQRTTDLTESLERQTATSEILASMSGSMTTAKPVFDAIVRNVLRLFGTRFAVVQLLQGGIVHIPALDGEPGFESLADRYPRPLDDTTAGGQAMLAKQVIHWAPVLGNPATPTATVQFAQDFGFNSVIAAPMIREGKVIGAIVTARRDATPFDDKASGLIKSFADQAVIAIENVRLFEAEQERTRELSDSLQQQTATADVLKVISRSTFDLQTVLQTLIESTAKLCDADQGTISRQKGGVFYRAEAYGYSREFMDYVRSIPVEPERGTILGRALLDGKVVHIPDVQNDREYTFTEAQRLGGFRTALGVPMLRERVPIGVFVLSRSEVRPFTDKQIELATTFADQAAIAIENVRLFDEIQDKSRQLEVASQHKSQFLANMSHELRTPLNAILGYTELMADGAYGEPSEKMLGILKRLEANGRHLLGLINDVLDLSKIEAGQLVLELSDYAIQDIAQTVRSTLEPLAADKKLGFKVEIAPELPPGRGDGRRLTQVLINLVGNAIKFTDAGEVVIKAEANNGSFYVSVSDTGPGISAADQEKLFQEFQQADNAITRNKGGTGLGLAISKHIIEMHGGKIWVESQVGQGSTFAFTLPVIVERQVEVG